MKKWTNWDLESGYHHDIYSVEVKKEKNSTSHRRRRAATAAKSFSNEELPLRGIAPGKSMGLNVMLNVKEDEYYCSGTESVGFKTLLHMPMAMPELLEYGYGVYPGMETWVSVVPEMVVVDTAIHKFDYHQRQCYLNDDRDLYFFRNYTFLNCFMECASNYTFEVCYATSLITSLGILQLPIGKEKSYAMYYCVSVPISALWMRGFLHAQRPDQYAHLFA